MSLWFSQSLKCRRLERLGYTPWYSPALSWSPPGSRGWSRASQTHKQQPVEKTTQGDMLESVTALSSICLGPSKEHLEQVSVLHWSVASSVICFCLSYPMIQQFLLGRSDEFMCGPNRASEKLWPRNLEGQRPGEAKGRATEWQQTTCQALHLFLPATTQGKSGSKSCNERHKCAPLNPYTDYETLVLLYPLPFDLYKDPPPFF